MNSKQALDKAIHIKMMERGGSKLNAITDTIAELKAWRDDIDRGIAASQGVTPTSPDYENTIT